MICINLMSRSVRKCLQKRRWRERNREKERGYVSAWGKKNREKRRERGRIYYIKNREHCIQNHKRWRNNNPDKRLQMQRRRRARKLGSGGTFTEAQFLELCIKFNNVCVCCLRSKSILEDLGLSLVPDHVLPLSKGGSNFIENIQPLCSGRGGCNNIKGAKHIDYRW